MNKPLNVQVVWSFLASVQVAFLSLTVTRRETKFPFLLLVFDNGLCQKPATS